MKRLEKIMEGIIYKAENIQNGYVYIGTTTKSIEERRKDHEQKANSGQGHKFQEAISTYGACAFNWKQIDIANTIDELARKESEYILKYNSKEDGYNASRGAEHCKSVYQYKIKDGSLFNKFDCLKDAAKTIGAVKQQISRACLSVNKVFGGFYWSYDQMASLPLDQDKRTKQVVQLELDGSLINVFLSVSQASEVTRCNKSSIAKVCRGERNYAGGFIWQYK